MTPLLRCFVLLFVLGATLLDAPPSAHAEDGPNLDERVARVKSRLADLRKAAERAREAGRMEQAIELERAAQAYAAQFERLVRERQGHDPREDGPRHREEPRHRDGPRHREGRRPGPRRAPRPDAERRVEHERNVLREALRILEARDAPEEAKRGVVAVLERLERSRHTPRVRRDHGPDRRRDRERALRGRVATLRMAVPVLRAAGEERHARLLERAILAGDLRLAGREDPGARAAYERAPEPAALAEVLQHAARLAGGQEQPERAERIQDLARHEARAHRGRERHEERAGREPGRHAREGHEREMHEREMHERERREREMHERERREQAHREARALEELTHEVERLRAHMEELRRRLEELRRR